MEKKQKRGRGRGWVLFNRHISSDLKTSHKAPPLKGSITSR
jgi:hypothetical protein